MRRPVRVREGFWGTGSVSDRTPREGGWVRKAKRGLESTSHGKEQVQLGLCVRVLTGEGSRWGTGKVGAGRLNFGRTEGFARLLSPVNAMGRDPSCRWVERLKWDQAPTHHGVQVGGLRELRKGLDSSHKTEGTAS